MVLCVYLWVHWLWLDVWSDAVSCYLISGVYGNGVGVDNEKLKAWENVVVFLLSVLVLVVLFRCG